MKELNNKFKNIFKYNYFQIITNSQFKELILRNRFIGFFNKNFENNNQKLILNFIKQKFN